MEDRYAIPKAYSLDEPISLGVPNPINRILFLTPARMARLVATASTNPNDRLRISTVAGQPFATGKTVQVDATVWAASNFSPDSLDIYFAANANAPNWIYAGTAKPTAAGPQTLSLTYVLPDEPLQAVRANFRYGGRPSPCSTGDYDDHDDLAFATISTSPPPPPPAITSPASATGTVGTAFSYTITATNSPTSFSASVLPSGFSVNAATGSQAAAHNFVDLGFLKAAH